MSSNGATGRTRLDTRLNDSRGLGNLPRPHRGWIRAVRDALGMSSTELAARLGVSQQTVPDLERSEIHDTIKLETLRRTANALECDLVYVLLPRRPLNDIVRDQARRKAAQLLAGVAHHGRLEDQTVDERDTAAQLDELASRYIDRRGLWTED
jgi:predicted DNA-binding mobile mystery protein A